MAAAWGKRFDGPITKVSKVYFGLSRVSRALGLGGVIGGTTTAGGSAIVDMSIWGLMDSSTLRSVATRGVWLSSSCGLTVTAMRIWWPNDSVSESSSLV